MCGGSEFFQVDSSATRSHFQLVRATKITVIRGDRWFTSSWAEFISVYDKIAHDSP